MDTQVVELYVVGDVPPTVLLIRDQPIYSQQNMLRIQERLEMLLVEEGTKGEVTDLDVKEATSSFPYEGEDLSTKTPKDLKLLRVRASSSWVTRCEKRHARMKEEEAKKKVKAKKTAKATKQRTDAATKQVPQPVQQFSQPNLVEAKLDSNLVEAKPDSPPESKLYVKLDSNLAESKPKPVQTDLLETLSVISTESNTNAVAATSPSSSGGNSGAMPQITPTGSRDESFSTSRLNSINMFIEPADKLIINIDPLQQLFEMVNGLKATVDEQAKTIADQATKIAALEASKVDNEKTIAGQAKTIADQAKTIADQAKTIADQATKIAALTDRVDKLESKRASLKTDLINKETALDETEKKTVDLQTIVLGQKIRLANSIDEEIALRSLFEHLRTEIFEWLGLSRNDYQRNPYVLARQHRGSMAKAFLALFKMSIHEREIDLLCEPYEQGNSAAHRKPSAEMAAQALFKFDCNEYTFEGKTTAERFFAALYPNTPFVSYILK